eukprot:gene5510-7192_t
MTSTPAAPSPPHAATRSRQPEMQKSCMFTRQQKRAALNQGSHSVMQPALTTPGLRALHAIPTTKCRWLQVSSRHKQSVGARTTRGVLLFGCPKLWELLAPESGSLSALAHVLITLSQLIITNSRMAIFISTFPPNPCPSH